MANTFDVTAGQIQRQRDLLNALASQSMAQGPGGMAGNVYVGQGLLSALAKPLAMVAANYGQGQLDTKDLANAQARQQAIQQELQGYMGGQGGQIGQPPPGPQQANPDGTSSFAAGSQQPIGTSAPVGSPLVSAMAGQQQAQVPGPNGFNLTGALASQFPEIQAIGQAGLKAQLGRKPETFTPQTAMGPDGKPMTVLQGNYGSVKQPGYNPAVEPKIFRGEAYNPYDLQPGQTVGAEYKQPVTNINNNLPAQEKARDVALGTSEGKSIQASREKGIAAQNTFMFADRLQNLNQDGVLTGALVKPVVFINQLASGLGFTIPDNLKQKLANTENWDIGVRNQLKDMILNSTGVGRGFTDTDREYVAKSFPDLLQTPQGRADAINFLKQASVRGVDQARQIETSVKNGTISNLDLTGGKMDQFRQTMGQGQIPSIQDEAGYNALPSGTTYRGPDGQTRRKQ